MSAEEFANAMREALATNASWDDWVRIMREYKDNGLTQQSAYEAVQALRSTNEVLDDRVLEALDIVSGFCHPSYRVWDGTVT